MASTVTVAYGETVIHTATSSGTFTLNTEETYLDEDISIDVSLDPSGSLPSATGVSF